ncbi:MAG: hypothetical protein RL122_443 [Pseudomonadota bacterium]|jgi:coenzyme F420-reducing hydrogenase alpha subunit
MQSLENLVGQLQLTLHYTRDAGLCRVNAVHLHSNRLCLNAHFLTGKSVELAPKLTGMLFSLATWAHMVSCLDSSPPVPVTVVAIGGLERMALLPTARGLLVHRVVQVDGLICTYQIVAPTEWNFHPQGSPYSMLSSLQAKNALELRTKAKALITALDPCVAYQLEIIPDA